MTDIPSQVVNCFHKHCRVLLNKCIANCTFLTVQTMRLQFTIYSCLIFFKLFCICNEINISRLYLHVAILKIEFNFLQNNASINNILFLKIILLFYYLRYVNTISLNLLFAKKDNFSNVPNFFFTKDVTVEDTIFM